MFLIEISLEEFAFKFPRFISYIREYPELFFILKSPAPTGTIELRSLFGIYFNDFIEAYKNKQILTISGLPRFMPRHNYYDCTAENVLDLERFLLNKGSCIYHDGCDVFWDEISFLLQIYEMIYVSDKCDSISVQRGHTVFKSAALLDEFISIENEINKRIHPSPWKIKVFLKHNISRSSPPPLRPGNKGLTPIHWEFQQGRQLPHDRFWADRYKRVFITTSVGLQFQKNHIPIIYPLSSEIRRKRSSIITFT
jgi:hypothetical protein